MQAPNIVSKGRYMAVLSNTDRQRIWRGLMRYWSNQREVLSSITKDDLQAAVNAADDWVNANAASFNNALPATFKANASVGQKAFLLVMVTITRGNVVFLRSILGDID